MGYKTKEQKQQVRKSGLNQEASSFMKKGVDNFVLCHDFSRLKKE
jgi:hypothetical protein